MYCRKPLWLPIPLPGQKNQSIPVFCKGLSQECGCIISLATGRSVLFQCNLFSYLLMKVWVVFSIDSFMVDIWLWTFSSIKKINCCQISGSGSGRACSRGKWRRQEHLREPCRRSQRQEQCCKYLERREGFCLSLGPFTSCQDYSRTQEKFKKATAVVDRIIKTRIGINKLLKKLICHTGRCLIGPSSLVQIWSRKVFVYFISQFSLHVIEFESDKIQ